MARETRLVTQVRYTVPTGPWRAHSSRGKPFRWSVCRTQPGVMNPVCSCMMSLWLFTCRIGCFGGR